MEPEEAPGTRQDASPRTRRRVGMVVAGIVVLGLAGGVLHWMGVGSYLAQRHEYANRAPTFSGTSDSLKQTVIVPTLDTPCPPGKNVIWCSSFQLAWNEVKDNVIGAPLQVIGAEEVAARLNAAKQSAADLTPQSYYIAAGRVEDRIVDRIKKEMASRFPSHTLPDFNDDNSGILSYAYLHANVPFKHPFRQMDKGLAFTDSQGVKTQVVGFGLWEAYARAYEKIRDQVEIVHVACGDTENAFEPTEYVLDLCRYSKPYQVILARVELKGSLAATLAYVRARMADFNKAPVDERMKQLGRADEVKAPEMFWRIDHRFQELIGRTVANVGMPIVEALQTVELRLDRSGAKVESEAVIPIKALGTSYTFNRPFLVYMQKRNAEQPFFVMWVDNAELLTRRGR